MADLFTLSSHLSKRLLNLSDKPKNLSIPFPIFHPTNPAAATAESGPANLNTNGNNFFKIFINPFGNNFAISIDLNGNNAFVSNFLNPPNNNGAINVVINETNEAIFPKPNLLNIA